MTTKTILNKPPLNTPLIGQDLAQYHWQTWFSDVSKLLPASQVNADWNATSGVAEILNKPTPLLWGGFVAQADWPLADVLLPTFFWDTDSDNLMVRMPQSYASPGLIKEVSTTDNPIQSGGSGQGNILFSPDLGD